MIRILLLAILACALCLGCTSVYFCAASDDFLTIMPEDRPFEVIGPVHACTWEWVFLYFVPVGPTYHEAEVLLVQEAKKIGADAVVDVQYHTESDCDESSLSRIGIPFVGAMLVCTRSYHFSGLAIKYTDGGKE